MDGKDAPRESKNVTHVGQEAAAAIDKDLMSIHGFKLEQLMELAGLSVASSIAAKYNGKKGEKILVICGPGNNGGDGLVAARHLCQFGFSKITICYPKYFENPKDPYFKALISQVQDLGITVSPNMPEQTLDSFGLILDSIFGFSFKGTSARAPFDKIIASINASKSTVVSIDVPSGWHVEEGNKSGSHLR